MARDTPLMSWYIYLFWLDSASSDQVVSIWHPKNHCLENSLSHWGADISPEQSYLWQQRRRSNRQLTMLFFFLIRLAQNPAAKPAGFINGSQICLKTQWEECVLQKQEAIYIWRAPSYMRPPVQVSGYFSWLSWFSPWLRTNPHLLALFFRDEGYPGLERPLGLIKPYKRPASSLRRLLA